MNEPDDRELERFLEGKSALSRRYREASREEVPPDLDEIVLAQARAAAARKPRPNRWLTPLALAASVVLGINIAWNLREHADAPGVLPTAAVPERLAAEPAAKPGLKNASDTSAGERAAARAAPAAVSPSASRETPTSIDDTSTGWADDLREAEDRAAASAAEQRARSARVDASSGEMLALQASENDRGRLPDGWHLSGNDAAAYEAAIDQSVAHSPPHSLALWRTGRGSEGCGRLERSVAAEPYRSRPVRFIAKVQSQGINRVGALGIAVDGERPRYTEMPPGDTPWVERALVFDVPAHAKMLTQSVLLCGSGTVWIDDARLETAAAREPATDD